MDSFASQLTLSLAKTSRSYSNCSQHIDGLIKFMSPLGNWHDYTCQRKNPHQPQNFELKYEPRNGHVNFNNMPKSNT